MSKKLLSPWTRAGGMVLAGVLVLWAAGFRGGSRDADAWEDIEPPTPMTSPVAFGAGFACGEGAAQQSERAVDRARQRLADTLALDTSRCAALGGRFVHSGTTYAAWPRDAGDPYPKTAPSPGPLAARRIIGHHVDFSPAHFEGSATLPAASAMVVDYGLVATRCQQWRCEPRR
jgi:hypothetical protein